MAVFGSVPRGSLATVRRMAASGVNAPFTSGLGRYFDAMGALGLNRTTSRYEGEIAVAWEQAADADEHRPYPFAVDESAVPWTIDLRATVRAAVDDLLAGSAPGAVSARFHETVVRATVAVLTCARSVHGALPVLLTGGCFQNARLAEGIARALTPSPVYRHGRIPPGDGGIALGQAVVADAVVRRGA